jgi:hypothetical protein
VGPAGLDSRVDGIKLWGSIQGRVSGQQRPESVTIRANLAVMVVCVGATRVYWQFLAWPL